MEPPDRRYRNDVIRIVDLVATETTLEELAFDTCEIVGPAVLIPIGSQFRRCQIEGPEALWRVERGRSYVGAIGVRNCLFESCLFRRIGLAGDDEFVRRFLDTTSGA